MSSQYDSNQQILSGFLDLYKVKAEDDESFGSCEGGNKIIVKTASDLLPREAF